MLQSVLMVRSLKLIFFVNPLIAVSFVSFTQYILFTNETRLCIAKGIKRLCSKKDTFENTLKVCVLGLASVVIPKNLLTTILGGFLKANQSSYLKVEQRLGLVYHL